MASSDQKLSERYDASPIWKSHTLKSTSSSLSSRHPQQQNQAHTFKPHSAPEGTPQPQKMNERCGLRKLPRVSYVESVEQDVDEAEERVTEVERGEDVELHHTKVPALLLPQVCIVIHTSCKLTAVWVAKMTPTKPTRAKERECFRFFDLPGEIRNEIYKFALISPCRIILERPVYAERRKFYRNRWQQFSEPLEVNVIFLNKATFAEAAPFLYKNEFYFCDSTEMLEFLSGLSPTAKTWIEEINLVIEMTPHYLSGNLSPVFDSLNDLASLRAFSRVSECESVDGEYSNHHIAQELYYVAYDWLRIIGHEKGYKTAGVDLMCLSDSWGMPVVDILSELKKIITMDSG